MPSGSPSADVQKQGAWNAALETGLASPLDDAILSAGAPDLSAVRKLAEIPFDFVRKRVSVVVDAEGQTSLITKGAFHHVLEICTRSADGVAARCRGEGAPRGALPSLERTGDPGAGRRVTNGGAPAHVRQGVGAGSHLRRLPHLFRPAEGRTWPTRFAAWPRSACPSRSSRATSKPVTQHVAGLVGLRADRVLTGTDLQRLSDEALWRAAESDRSLRRGGSESEGADHPGAQEDGARRRLSRRRRERCARHARGRHQPLGRAGGRCGQGGGGFRPARAKPGCHPPRHSRKAARRLRTR